MILHAKITLTTEEYLVLQDCATEKGETLPELLDRSFQEALKAEREAYDQECKARENNKASREKRG